MLTLTPAQQKVIDRLQKDLLEMYSYGTGENYEYKQWEITPSHVASFKHVFLVAVIGMKNDEHTMASLFCREKRHICVGPNGGVSLLNAGRFVKDKEGNLKRVPRKSNTDGYWNCVHSLACY